MNFKWLHCHTVWKGKSKEVELLIKKDLFPNSIFTIHEQKSSCIIPGCKVAFAWQQSPQAISTFTKNIISDLISELHISNKFLFLTAAVLIKAFKLLCSFLKSCIYNARYKKKSQKRISMLMFTLNPPHRHHAKRPVASVLPHCSGIYHDILPVWSRHLGVVFVLHGWRPIPDATDPEPLLSSLITCSLGMDGWIERGWRRSIWMWEKSLAWDVELISLIHPPGAGTDCIQPIPPCSPLLFTIFPLFYILSFVMPFHFLFAFVYITTTYWLKSTQT